jgi:hypothetical protein
MRSGLESALSMSGSVMPEEVPGIEALELTILMPCLDEAQTVATYVRRARVGGRS